MSTMMSCILTVITNVVTLWGPINHVFAYTIFCGPLLGQMHSFHPHEKTF